MRGDETKKIVRDGYAKIARESSCCCQPATSCCGGTDLAQDISKKIGYTEEEIGAVPEGAQKCLRKREKMSKKAIIGM